MYTASISVTLSDTSSTISHLSSSAVVSASARISSSAVISQHSITASSIHSSLITGTILPAAIVSSSLTGLGTLTNLTVSGSISVDSGTLHVDPTNNRVGVGTTSPNQSLAVVGTASITSTTNVGGLLTSASIGIGTLTPASALHVVGGTNITGNASVGGNVFVVGTLNATSYGSSSAASAGTLYMSASATRVWGASARLTATSGSINGTTGTSIDFPSLLQSVEAGRKSVVVTQRNPDALPGFIFSTSPGTSNFVIKGINVVNTSYSGNVDVNIIAVSVE